MLRYAIRRLLISLPTLLVISIAVFSLNKCAPGDPVLLTFKDDEQQSVNQDEYAEHYRLKAAELGLDKPVFYCNLTVAAFSDTLWKINPLSRREKLAELVEQNGNWPATSAFDAALNRANVLNDKLPDSVRPKPYLRVALAAMVREHNLENLEMAFVNVDSLVRQVPPSEALFLASIGDLRAKTHAICHDFTPNKLWIPAFHWYGFQNQYHHWLKGFVTGDWGLSKSKKPIWAEMKPALYATMALNIITIALAYLIAIFLGVEMARRRNGLLDRWVQRILVFIHAMPLFWLGGLLILLFVSPIFGKPLLGNPYLDISDAWNEHSQSFFSWFVEKLPKFLLPILVMTLYSLTTLALQMRGGMLETLNQDYIRTARAKGVQEEDVYWSHAFRNALFPIITMFSAVFPAMFTGSLVIETLFNFPGMGLKSQNAFSNHDLAMLSAILMAAALFTIVGNFVADILYAWVDPRVRYAAEK